METSDSIYTEGQIAIIRKAYDEVKSHVGPAALASSTPLWFVPWYELQLGQYSDCLGKGSFGSVFRAKWLNSDVVVKEVMSETSSSGSLAPSYLSKRSQSTVKTPSTVDPTARQAPALACNLPRKDFPLSIGRFLTLSLVAVETPLCLHKEVSPSADSASRRARGLSSSVLLLGVQPSRYCRRVGSERSCGILDLKRASHFTARWLNWRNSRSPKHTRSSCEWMNRRVRRKPNASRRRRLMGTQVLMRRATS
jgi:hypothetical protein